MISFASRSTAYHSCNRKIHAVSRPKVTIQATAIHAADRFKEPPHHASLTLIQEWNNADKQLHSFLASSIPEALQHTGSAAFDQHLLGVQAVLRNWGAKDEVARAGLFHSIYGTEGYQGFKLSFSKRKEIRALIGEKSERLVWIFCCIDRLSVDELVEKELNHIFDQIAAPSLDKAQQRKYECYSRSELGRFPIEFASKDEWIYFVELTLADWLEQVEGAAERSNDLYGWAVGEAWSYRRIAYHQMAELLVAQRGMKRMEAMKEMVEEVYGSEPMATRGLHMKRTPPMNDAAREAREAIESISL